MTIKRIAQKVINKPGLRIKIIAGVILLVAVWLCFFDSHSLIKRVRWHKEFVMYRAENDQLVEQIEALTLKLEEGITDEEIEKIAREEFGMRRPGETVYRIDASH